MQKMHFKLIQCIEGEASQSEQAEAAWRKCCDVLRFSEEPIDTCYESGEGRKVSFFCLSPGKEKNSSGPILFSSIIQADWNLSIVSTLSHLCGW